jgi:hypothetical protein
MDVARRLVSQTEAPVDMSDQVEWIAVYASQRPARVVLIALAGLALVLGAVVVIVAAASGKAGLPLLAWSLFWFPFFLALAYQEILLVADTVATDGLTLRWSGFRRRGEWPLSDLASMRRGGMNRRYIRVKNVTGERFLVYPAKGWQEFVSVFALSREIDLSIGAKWYERGGAFRWQRGWPAS